MPSSFDIRLQRVWYGAGGFCALLLSPLALLFRSVVAVRRWAYARGLRRSFRVSRPVIVIGNITVGGTGKTPFTLWLANQLQRQGLRVGIVLRGYGGVSRRWPRDVESSTSWREVGDEAVLLAARTGATVVAGPDRVAAARRAIERGADVVLCDDGLQHYRLRRDLEVAVVDAERRLGNARMLPAGPLREPAGRLERVDLIVVTQRELKSDGLARTRVPQVSVRATLREATALLSGERRALTAFRGQRVHAIAGIGNPAAFFAALAAAGLEVDGRALADHAQITPDDLRFGDQAPVLMTEKDAVKCGSLAGPEHWSVAMDIEISETDAAVVHSVVARVLSGVSSH